MGLICIEEREGGNIIVMNPEGELAASIHMTEGKVLCGRWARSLHCNEAVTDGKRRFSMVAYCDSRITTGTYLPRYELHPTEQVAAEARNILRSTGVNGAIQGGIENPRDIRTNNDRVVNRADVMAQVRNNMGGGGCRK